MAATLPIIFVALVFLALQKFKLTDCWRSSFLLTAILGGFTVATLTEACSIFNSLEYVTLLVAWILVNVVVISLLLVCGKKRSQSCFSCGCKSLLVFFNNFEILLLVGVLMMMVLIGTICYIAPPNNGDSMTYHMAKVVHWIQNRNVGFYPTHNLRHLYLNPWSEYAITHLQVLSGGDHFANFVQWFCMLGSLVGVSYLAKLLGADIRGQIFASVFLATIPMGILQASSTQNDYVVSFWLLCFVCFLLRFLRSNDSLDAFASGAAVGLAVLTKATTYLYAFPFAAWWGINAIRSSDLKRIKLLALSLLIAITINLPNYSRNYNLFGTPVAAQADAVTFTNDIFSIPSFLSNVVRNVAMHAQSPSWRLNELITDGIIQFHDLLGIPIDDKRTTWNGTIFRILHLHVHEDTSGNPFHIAMILFAVAYVLVQNRDPLVLKYLFCWLLGFFIFCLYLRWQPWASRLHLPLFVLFAAVFGLAISNLKNWWVSDGIAVFLMLAALPYIFYGYSRPLVGNNNIFSRTRVEQYFSNLPGLAAPYKKAVQVVGELNCSQIGLILGSNDFEYPFWVLRSAKMRSTDTIEHVLVTNSSAKARSKGDPFVPCCIISTQNTDLEKLTMGDLVYLRLWNQDRVSVYVIDSDSRFPQKLNR